jgi:hypothetical protein
MAQSTLLLSVVAGVVLVATVAFLSSRGWRQYAPAALSTGGERDHSLMTELAGNQTVWVLAFLAAIVVFGGGTVMAVGGGPSAEMAGTAGLVLLAAAAAVAVGYLFFGTFIAAKGHGLGNAAAAMLGSWVLGLLFIVVLVVKLMGMI